MDAGSIIWIVGLFAMMYFMMIRPQQKATKERKEMMAALKKGLHVIAIGGLHGVIYSLTDEMVTLEISTGIYVQINRAAVDKIVTEDDAEDEEEDDDEDADEGETGKIAEKSASSDKPSDDEDSGEE